MSNLLKVAMIDLVLSLHRQGLSQRRIANELGINRETVARYLSQPGDAAKPANAPPGSIEAEAEPKPANAPPGSIEAEAESKPANAPPGSSAPEPGVNNDLSPPPLVPERVGRRHGRRSECEPWRSVIQAKCDLGLSAQRIYQDLVTEQSFTGAYYSVRRFVRRLAPATELPFRRLECGPGEEAQVDFGKGARIVGHDGKCRKFHLFCIVLSHSRKAYSDVV
jgi:transposase